MKPSGVEWVGDIPTDWNVEPFFRVMPQSGRSNSGLTEVNLLSLSYGQIIQRDIDSNDGLLPASFETYQIVEPGDIVFRFTDLQNDKRSLRSALVRERGIITSAYLAVAPSACLPSYVDFLMRSYDTTKVFYSFGGGVRQSLTYSDVKHLPMLVPPIEVQRAIVDFLDRETAQIDALIRKQEQLISMLNERRSAMITHAVTRGLNPDVQTKDSGVAGLGRVPSPWLSLPVWALYRERDERVGTSVDLPLLAVSIHHGVVPRSQLTGDEPRADDLSKYKVCRAGDIVLNRMRAFQGGIGVSNQDGIVSPDYLVMEIAEAANSHFLSKLFRTPWFVHQMTARLRGIGSVDQGNARTPRINPHDLGRIYVALPPLDQQHTISVHVDFATARIDALIDKAKAMNVVLRERRAALISAAVTGKIDVTKRIEGAA